MALFKFPDTVHVHIHVHNGNMDVAALIINKLSKMSETSDQILAKVTAQGEKITTQGTIIDLIKGDLDYVKGQLSNATGGY